MNRIKNNDMKAKLIKLSPEMIKQIENYKEKYYFPSFTATVRELIRIGLSHKNPRD